MDRDFEAYAEITSDWFWETDADHRFTYFSSRVEEVFGIRGESLGLSRMEVATNAEDRELWDPHLADLKARRPFKNFIYPFQHPDGRRLWLRTTGVPCFDDAGIFLGYRGSCTDITAEVEASERADAATAALKATIAELRETNAHLQQEIEQRELLEAKLVKLARTDPLTGLLNRRAFLEMAEREFARAERSDGDSLPLVVMLDIDHFKSINDEFGHAVGDQVISGLADCITEAVRQTDYVGRLGGEEFAIILHPTTMTGGSVVLERVAKHFKARATTYGVPDQRLSFSGGIAPLDPALGTFDACLERADTALYDAKRSGRNRVVLAENHDCTNNYGPKAKAV